MSLKRLTTLLALVCFSTSVIAQEAGEETNGADEQPTAEYVLESGELFVVQGEERNKVELPAPAQAILVQGDELYVAMGASGAALYDITESQEPVLIRRVETGREQVVGFIVVGSEVWMRVVSEAAVPVTGRSLAGSEPTVIVAPKPTDKEVEVKIDKPEDRELRSEVDVPVSIVKVSPGEVKLDAGTCDGVKVGDRFSVFRKIEIEDKVDGEGSFEGRELAGVIEVVAVNEDSSIAEIWRGDRVTMNDEVAPADKDHKTSLPFPRRLDHLAEVSITIRPFLDLNHGGVGGLADLAFTYVGSAWFAGIAVQPTGFAFNERGNLINTIAVAEGGYDGRAFGLGIGAGVMAYSAKANKGWKDEEPVDSPINQGWTNSGAGFVLSQVFRLGPRDGLNFTGRNTLINMEWGGVHGTFDIPLTRQATLFFEGGGSVHGYGMGALGVSTWLKGNGDSGSIGLSASAGFAATWVERDEDDEEEEEDDIDNVLALGPMISIGVDYRF